jgi:uncharacterized protein
MKNPLVKNIEDAIRAGRIECVRALFLEHPEMVTVSDPFAWLGIAAHQGNRDMVQALLEIGCDVNDGGKLPSMRIRALSTAVDRDEPEIVRLLLENGANPNLNRCVIGAVVGGKQNSVQLLQLLEQHGADMHRLFPLGESDKMINALSMATAYGNQPAIDYLLSKGATMPPPPEATGPQSLDDEIVAYFREHFGPVLPQSLIEIVPSGPQIAIHVVPPDKERTHTTLFTTGMSRQPMTIPEGGDANYQFAELFIQLPGRWPLGMDDLEDLNYGWPIHWLRQMAAYPHRENTWLGGPVAIVNNGDPPEPLAPNLKFTCLLLLAEAKFTSREGRTVQFYRLSPLYTEEFNLEQREGISALMRAFDEYGVPFVMNPDRPNVAL